MRAKVLVLAVVVVCAATRAHALTQPDGTAIPVKMGCDSGHPTGLAAIFATQCSSGGPNIGAACPGNQDPGACDGGDCCASIARLAQTGYVYYSQREFNPDAAGLQSFIHLLAYDSTLWPHKFYFAWEDLYAGGGNDDFADLVTSVDGVECS